MDVCLKHGLEQGFSTGVKLTCLGGVNFDSQKFTLLPTTIGICRSENIKKIWELNFTIEICQGVNEKIKVENPWSRVRPSAI